MTTYLTSPWLILPRVLGLFSVCNNFLVRVVANHSRSNSMPIPKESLSNFVKILAKLSGIQQNFL